MIASIFKTLQYFITERVPDIKYISLYNNQFNNSDSNRPLPMPAVLIEILPINFDDLLQNVQMSIVEVNIHLGTEIYNGFDRDDSMQDTSLDHLKLLDKLYIGLNRVNTQDLPDELKDDNYIISAGFKRNRVTLQNYNSPINHSIINGSFKMFDLSAMKKWTEYELEDIKLKSWYYPIKPEGPFNPDIKELDIKL